VPGLDGPHRIGLTALLTVCDSDAGHPDRANYPGTILILRIKQKLNGNAKLSH